MRILSVRGRNLASLEEEFVMDFTAEPLRSAGIFAITGATGSGKSTLLDALCLALFDDTPRANHAGESVQIGDVRDRTINQKDCRNVLRRGTSEGFAEVDFMSLAGERFRSRWSVRRSRDRVDGVLQNSELRLTNLSAGVEVQGRKTELLARVVKLIGLTFEQFTRTVLLAQGDFAIFLKASQKEKAELLEKLTGAEIYSRISALIFEKSKAAEQVLVVIKERMRDVVLLSEEELAGLEAERGCVAGEIVALNGEMEVRRGMIKWLDDEAMLREGIARAERLLADAEGLLAEAKPRCDFLAEIDGVQDIRDRFNELRSAERQLADNEVILEGEVKRRDVNVLLLKEVVGRIAASETELKRHTEDFQAVEVRVKQARDLDVQIAGAGIHANEAEREFRLVREEKARLDRAISETSASMASAQKVAEVKAEWFEHHRRYEAIVPRMDLIVNLLDDAASADRQRVSNEKIRVEGKALLDRESEELAGWMREAERLNRLLPAEIVALRARLEEGVPCPVCGSVHHPAGAAGQGGESLEEAKLNRAKGEAADRIEALRARMEGRKAELIRLDSMVERYTEQSKEARGRLRVLLADFPAWEAAFEKGNLQGTLRAFAVTWNGNVAEQAGAKEQLARLQTALLLAQEQRAEAEGRFVDRESRCREAKAALEGLVVKRRELFEGKSADEVERFYVRRTKELSEALAGLQEERNGVAARCEKQIGIVNRIVQERERLAERCGRLRREVEEWRLTEGRGITLERLRDLLSKDHAWIVAEREVLNGLLRERVSAMATLEERRKTLDDHLRLDGRPTAEAVDRAGLQASLEGMREAGLRKNARMAEIDLLFVNHRRGRERIARFEEELREKGALSENWKRLNELFGSADGAKFKVLAQGYTLDALLAYANRHLQELSQRYRIERIADTLALQVVDADMLGEVRTVHSLSGGESFLISLALALGLSSLSSNRMKIESLFIDEGFGSLDIDTLRVAMDALERLQTQGRKIGVISHVPEMTERISVRIQVEKQVNGKSKINVVSG
jgi:exonuclease SbcC